MSFNKLHDQDDFDVGARLKELRIAAGLSQRELAMRAGVAHGMISVIEQNKHSPSIASLRKILGGISMTMADFFQEEAKEENKIFFSPEELIDLTSKVRRINSHKNKRLILRQVGNAREHDLQILHERYPPGADTGPTMLEHNSHEGGIILSGELEVTVGKQTKVLKAGDSYLFDSRIPIVSATSAIRFVKWSVPVHHHICNKHLDLNMDKFLNSCCGLNGI